MAARASVPEQTQTVAMGQHVHHAILDKNAATIPALAPLALQQAAAGQTNYALIPEHATHSARTNAFLEQHSNAIPDCRGYAVLAPKHANQTAYGALAIRIPRQQKIVPTALMTIATVQQIVEIPIVLPQRSAKALSRQALLWN